MGKPVLVVQYCICLSFRSSVQLFSPQQQQDTHTHIHTYILCTHPHYFTYHYSLFNRYVLYKEKNMLLTERNLSRRKGIVFPQPERWKKVKRSMAAIKVVLGERKREKLTERAIRMS
jgi:ribosomal protein L29